MRLHTTSTGQHIVFPGLDVSLAELPPGITAEQCQGIDFKTLLLGLSGLRDVLRFRDQGQPDLFEEGIKHRWHILRQGR